MDFLKLFGLTTDKDSPPPVDEQGHINQEIYKRSVELSERNKTLSLLQKIDEIILGDIAHLNETAQRVTSLLVREIDFQLVTLFICDKKTATIKRVALSQAVQDGHLQNEQKQDIPWLSQVSFSDNESLLVQSTNERVMKSSQTVRGVLLPKSDSEGMQINQEALIIKSVFVYPFIVRAEVIGAMVICLRESEEELSQYRKDLMVRLVELIGIALDNSLLYNEVQENNKRLEALDRLKDEFVSLASHELRTPMTAIKSYLWMAMEEDSGPLTEKQRKYLERAHTSSNRLIKLVNDMLDVSRIDSGRVTLSMQAVQLDKLAEDVLVEVTPRAEEFGINLKLERLEPTVSVLGDVDKLKEVFFNLIGNALKFSPKNGTITISFTKRENIIETHITDGGVGIDAEDIAKLFQKFGLIESSYAPNAEIKGTGLGLYICKAIVQLHKGRIWAESPGKGQGSVFSFSLPIISDEALQQYNKEHHDPENATVDFISPTISS